MVLTLEGEKAEEDVFTKYVNPDYKWLASCLRWSPQSPACPFFLLFWHVFTWPITPGKDRGPHLHWLDSADQSFDCFSSNWTLWGLVWKIKVFFEPCCTDRPWSSGKELSRAEVEAAETVAQGGAKGKSDFWKKSKGRRPLINKISGFEWPGVLHVNFPLPEFQGGKETGQWKQNPLGVSVDCLKVKSIRTNFRM